MEEFRHIVAFGALAFASLAWARKPASGDCREVK